MIIGGKPLAQIKVWGSTSSVGGMRGEHGLWVLLPEHRQNSFVSIGEGGAILLYPLVLYVVSIVLLVYLLGREGGNPVTHLHSALQ